METKRPHPRGALPPGLEVPPLRSPPLAAGCAPQYSPQAQKAAGVTTMTFRVARWVAALAVTSVILATSACQRSEQALRHHPLSDGNSKLLLFVHGLGGDGQATWRGADRGFLELIKADPELSSQYDVAFFDYPTSGFGIPFLTTAPSIGELAAGLRTELDRRYPEYDSVVLVTHSMGGLVAKKYLAEEMAAGRPLRVKRLILFAVPNNGAQLANLAAVVPFKSRQMRQLARNSDFITELNESWARLGAEEALRIRYVVGGVDEVVDPDSARAMWGNNNVDVVVDRGHVDLVKPEGHDELAFLALRDFVNEARTSNTALVLTHGQSDWWGLREAVKAVAPTVEILEGDLLQHAERIGRARVLILALPHKRNFSDKEVNFVKKWVEKGGGLLLMGYYAADRHHENNASDIARAFGYEFADNLLMPPGSVYRDTRSQQAARDAKYAVRLHVSSQHEVTKGVSELTVLSSCALLSAGAAKPELELKTGESSSTWVPEYLRTPGGWASAIVNYQEAGQDSATVAVAFDAGGRVVITGTWKLFTVDDGDNARFVRNVLEWLAGPSAV